MRLAVAICTYRRPEALGRLLDALEALEPPTSGPTGAPVALEEALDVVVVDNDPAGAGRAHALARRGYR